MSTARESQLITDDGVTLFVCDWLTDAPIQHSIVIMHGLGEHCGRYRHVADFFNACGLSVRTYDHRGHGRSGGPRGDIPDPLSFVNDAEMVVRDFKQNGHVRPLLFGHSMGGLFAACLAARLAATNHLDPDFQLCGLILSSPALGLRLSAPETLLLKLMTGIAPHFGVPTRFNSRFLTHDQAAIQSNKNDPLVHDKITASLLSGMLDAIKFTQNHAPVINIPTLLLVSENDHLVDPQGSRMFVDNCPTQLVSAQFYPDFYHEIFNEADASRVFSDLKDWLTRCQFLTHLNTSPSSELL